MKGILGTDNRRYALDLFRIFPPDPNYTEVDDEDREGEGKEEREGDKKGEKEGEKKEKRGTKKSGCRHKLAVFRPELLESFFQLVFSIYITHTHIHTHTHTRGCYRYRYLVFLKLAKEKAWRLKVIQDLHLDLYQVRQLHRYE